MNRAQLSKELASRTLLTIKEADIVLSELTDIIVGKVANGEEVNYNGLGKFFPYQHTPRPVRNPKTKEEMMLESYRSLRFKSCTSVKNLLKTVDK